MYVHLHVFLFASLSQALFYEGEVPDVFLHYTVISHYVNSFIINISSSRLCDTILYSHTVYKS